MTGGAARGGASEARRGADIRSGGGDFGVRSARRGRGFRRGFPIYRRFYCSPLRRATGRCRRY